MLIENLRRPAVGKTAVPKNFVAKKEVNTKTKLNRQINFKSIY